MKIKWTKGTRTSGNKAFFTWVSKVIWFCFGFAFTRLWPGLITSRCSGKKRSFPEGSSRGGTWTKQERVAEMVPRLRLASKSSWHFLLLPSNRINLDSCSHSFSSAFWLAYKLPVKFAIVRSDYVDFLDTLKRVFCRMDTGRFRK